MTKKSSRHFNNSGSRAKLLPDAGAYSAYPQHYRDLGFDCEKVILVTHSMGGLAARAVCHPKMGNKEGSRVAGVVHGEQPAIGAAAAYKRMHAGFVELEEEFSWSNRMNWIAAHILGPSGREITAILSNAPGGLELLPTKRYPARWLKVPSENGTVRELPESDPYEEIYRVRDKWWRLVNPEWIEPGKSNRPPDQLDTAWENYKDQLKVAETFHETLKDYYHDHTHAHYGADSEHKTWGKDFTWLIYSAQPRSSAGMTALPNFGGSVSYIPATEGGEAKGTIYDNAKGNIRVESVEGTSTSYNMTHPDERGDGTVPEISGEDSASKAKFAAKMTGYDHQGSYKHEKVKAVTTYSVARIAKDIK